jgi:very-short-patch-repair endonuclease
MITVPTISGRKSQTQQRGFARAMRHIPMDAERKFWWRVRDRRLNGYKFKRQFLICKYIVDFVCLDRKLIVELDGGQHRVQVEYDEARSAFLRARGYRVMRFWNYDVLTNIEGVLEGVLRALGKTPSPQPSPPTGARE